MFCCVQHKLEDLPDGSKLALRDLSLTFPVGLGDVCRQAFQVLYDRLLERSSEMRSANKSRQNNAYNTVVSLLVTAREPLPLTAFSAANHQVCYWSLLSKIRFCYDKAVECKLSQ